MQCPRYSSVISQKLRVIEERTTKLIGMVGKVRKCWIQERNIDDEADVVNIRKRRRASAENPGIPKEIDVRVWRTTSDALSEG
jgi:hypothetical protein